jgi:hypothetical protein
MVRQIQEKKNRKKSDRRIFGLCCDPLALSQGIYRACAKILKSAMTSHANSFDK